MTQDVSRSASNVEALLQVSRDFVIMIKDGAVEICTPGDLRWLQAPVISGAQLSNLLPADILEPVTNVIEAALANPGKKHSLEYVLKPEHAPAFREAGLRETVWFDSVFVATETGEVFWSSRDVSERKKLLRKVSNQAQRDPLTGAFNRRALVTVMEQTVAQALRYDWTCSVMVIDVDGFSNINDQHGWDAGDQLLQQIVTGIHKLKRTADFLARYGDDQLVLFLPETNHEQGVAAAERVRRMVAEQEMPYPTGNVTCTVSVGVAGLRDAEDSAAEMLKRAEENLYIAFSSGGNRVEGETL